MSGKPWDGVIPVEDEAAYRTDPEQLSKPMQVGDNPALIIVDMTRAFVDSAYITGYSETGYPAVRANRLLLKSARNAGIPIFYTKQRAESHLPVTAAEQGLWKRRYAPSQSSAILPSGDVIVDDLKPIKGEVVINKHDRPSAFFGTPLASLLVYHRTDTLIVTGMATSGCVRATVVDAFQLNYRVIIPHESCADRSQISHKVSLFDMHMRYADVANTAEVIRYLNMLEPDNHSRAVRTSGS